MTKKLQDELLLNPNEELPDIKWWETEYWKQIPGADHYYVSTLGRIYSTSRHKLLKPIKGKNTAMIRITHNNREIHNHSLRKLVFETFFFEVPTTYAIISVDDNNMNCALDNLGLVKFYDYRLGHNKKENS